MNEYLAAVILGLVQGLTEFLPISSSGHLIIVSSLLGMVGPETAAFEIVIQLGSIFAVVVLYWKRFFALLFPQEGMRFTGIRGLWMLFLTCLPACVIGLFFGSTIKAHLFNPVSVSLALATRALFILLVEGKKKSPRYSTLDDMTPGVALGVGCFQCLSLWPGFSRSASTIMGGLVLGSSRSLAAEYSFIAAVPIMFAATGYELLKSHSLLTGNASFFLVGTLVAFVSAMAAIKVFIALVGRISFRPFAWYRLILAPAVYWFFS